MPIMLGNSAACDEQSAILGNSAASSIHRLLNPAMPAALLNHRLSALHRRKSVKRAGEAPTLQGSNTRGES
jgi:hypothetical protein